MGRNNNDDRDPLFVRILMPFFEWLDKQAYAPTPIYQCMRVVFWTVVYLVIPLGVMFYLKSIDGSGVFAEDSTSMMFFMLGWFFYFIVIRTLVTGKPP